MLSSLKSAYIWFAIVALILLWLPLLALIRVFDSDPVHYRTGRWFRRLGVAMTKVNPAWKLTVTGQLPGNPRNPYIVVSNHQSMADIPLISHLPWEMKWIGKTELFRLPVVGWMMRLAGDIPLERGNVRSGAKALLRAGWYLQRKCSVMFFPEGTRSSDVRVGPFNDGAFQLAIKYHIPILPVVVDGSHDCLPKKSWRFGPRQSIRVHVLSPVDTAAMVPGEAVALKDHVRIAIIATIAEWRCVPPQSVDAMQSVAPDQV
jgi:1-acyl-sn-glycerol-3-phosphate acyltransferase